MPCKSRTSICFQSLSCGLESIVLHDADYFDFPSYLKICATSRVLKSSATSPMGQGVNIEKRRFCATQEEMNVALESAADLATQTVIHSWWTPEDPFCCSKVCSFGGRTGLWIPRSDWDLDPHYLWWVSDTDSHTFYCRTPQVTVFDWIQNTRYGNKQYVVCSEMCSKVVRRKLRIMGLAYNSPTPKILLGVNEQVFDDSSE